MRNSFSRNAVFRAAGLLFLFGQAAKAEVPFDPPGNYSSSWLGNTYMDGVDHKVVTEELTDLCVSPNGHVFTSGYAEAFGGGAEYSAADGSFIARYDRFESGFGDPVKAVAADIKYVFWGTPGKGVLRSAQGGGGAGAYTTFLGGKTITGLFIKNGKLYASNFSDGKIHVFDTATMTEDRGWACANPTRLTVDDAGNVWVIRWNSASPQKPQEGSIWWGDKVVSFSSTGAPGPEISDFEKPLAVALNNSGQLLVGGLNQHSQIWIYDSDSDTMYLAGDVKDQNWGSFLRVKKFTDWSKGNRTASYTAELPYRDKDYAGNSNYGGGDPITLSVAGDYVFIGYGIGHVRILSKADGRLVGTLRQNVNGWKGSDGQVDAAYGMTVTLRKKGEYVVLFENAAWANIQLYRWCPGAACMSTSTTPSPKPNDK